jgi:hypothetical protein
MVPSLVVSRRICPLTPAVLEDERPESLSKAVVGCRLADDERPS